MLWKNRIANHEPGTYTTSGDFCRLFCDEMNSLYWLAFLLTGDAEIAEQCYVAGLEDCVNGNPVFRQWARSWARRTIVLNAIRAVAPKADPRLLPGSLEAPEKAAVNDEVTVPLAGFLELAAFDRFAFVMTVLEKYSVQECALLLGCLRHEVTEACSRAMQRLAGNGTYVAPPQMLPASTASVVHQQPSVS